MDNTRREAGRREMLESESGDGERHKCRDKQKEREGVQ